LVEPKQRSGDAVDCEAQKAVTYSRRFAVGEFDALPPMGVPARSSATIGSDVQRTLNLEV